MKKVDEVTKEGWQAIAEYLWDLLDDIDTAGDMFKPEITGYFKYVNRKAAGRHAVIKTDGYNFIAAEDPPPTRKGLDGDGTMTRNAT